MDLPTYKIPPQLRDELEHEFAKFRDERTIHGKPLAEWLVWSGKKDESSDQPAPDRHLPPDIRIELAARLENVLAMAFDGPKLLEALDGIIHEGGNPALLIEGLPTDESLAAIIREAFRSKMFPDPNHRYERHTVLQDIPQRWRRTGFEPDGNRTLHMDDANIVLIGGITKGQNAHHTEVVTIPELIGKIMERVKDRWPGVTERAVTDLLKKPVWRVKVTDHHTNDPKDMAWDARRQAQAESLGVLAFKKGIPYAPLIYDNPAHTSAIKGSQPYKILHAPFSHFIKRLKGYETRWLSREDKHMSLVAKAMKAIILETQHAKEGPVLKPGELLVFNNTLMLHAGGAFEHEKLDWSIRKDAAALLPRSIAAASVQRSPETYGARPTDSITQPILIGKAPGINPAVLSLNNIAPAGGLP